MHRWKPDPARSDFCSRATSTCSRSNRGAAISTSRCRTNSAHRCRWRPARVTFRPRCRWRSRRRAGTSSTARSAMDAASSRWRRARGASRSAARGSRRSGRLPPVAVEQIPEATEDRSLFLAPAAGLRRGGVNPAREPAERKRLEPDAPGTLQRGEEEPLAAEERRLQFPDELDVVFHRWLERHETAGVDTKRLPRRERALFEGAARVDEDPPVALQPLHDEPLAAEQSDAEAALEGDPDAHALRRGEERVLLRDDLAAELRQVHRLDLSGVGRRERGPPLVARFVVEDGHEERLAGEQALARAHQRTHESLALLGAVTEDGVHLNPVLEVHHRSRFGHDGFARIELDADELHVVAFDLVIDFVH